MFVPVSDTSDSSSVNDNERPQELITRAACSAMKAALSTRVGQGLMRMGVIAYTGAPKVLERKNSGSATRTVQLMSLGKDPLSAFTTMARERGNSSPDAAVLSMVIEGSLELLARRLVRMGSIGKKAVDTISMMLYSENGEYWKRGWAGGEGIAWDLAKGMIW